MKISSFPFHIGPTVGPHNPSGLPDAWSFSCDFDVASGALVQPATPELLDLLDRAYRTGQLIGTPLAGDDFGKPYADDFISFINEVACGGHTALEIGAGVGYTLRRMLDAGWQAIGVEPGKGYEAHWKHHGVDVINDFFPSVRTPGPFDLIYSYAVLEHIADTNRFLTEIRKRLSPGGVAVFSVPDCTSEIVSGDPAILLHEHFNYFNAETLVSVLWRAGFDAVVRKSTYGRCLYAVARPYHEKPQPPGRADLTVLESYPQRAQGFIERSRARLAALLAEGSVGIFCPARALALLDPAMPVRFFDDDRSQQGKYLPPFPAPIEDRTALLNHPVETVVIMSRTFGEAICRSLRADGYSGSILTIQEIL